eukprot:6180852-Pleurochrysis_carterae.AAC.3
MPSSFRPKPTGHRSPSVAGRRASRGRVQAGAVAGGGGDARQQVLISRRCARLKGARTRVEYGFSLVVFPKSNGSRRLLLDCKHWSHHQSRRLAFSLGRLHR